MAALLTAGAAFAAVEAYRTARDEFWPVAVPGLLTGVGTLALAFVTVFIASRERRHADELRHEDEERRQAQVRRAHAEQITAWYAGSREPPWIDGDSVGLPRPVINLANGSEQLVYEIVVWVVFIQGAAPRSGEDWMKQRSEENSLTSKSFHVLANLAPGIWSVTMGELPGVPSGHMGAEIAFTDRAGNHWIRRSNGMLEEIEKGAVQYYGIGYPAPYSQPENPY